MLLATSNFGVQINSNSGSSGNHTKALNSSKLALMKTIAIRASRSEYQNNTTTNTATTTTQGAHSNGVKINAAICEQNTNLKSSTNITTNNTNTSTTTTTTTAATNNNNNNTSRTVTKPTVNQSSNAATTKSTTVTSSSTTTAAATAKVVPSASFLKTYTVPPTALHRFSEERLRSCSIDSLHDEKCHFKPIRPIPTTPWKCGSKSRGATVKAPKASLAKIPLNCDLKPTSRRIGRESKRDKYKIKPKLSANLFPLAKQQPSAFARLLLPMSSYTIPSNANRIYKFGECANLRESTESGSDLDSMMNETKTVKKSFKSTAKAKAPKKRTAKQSTGRTGKAFDSDTKPTNTKKRKAQTNSKLNQTQQELKEFNKKRKVATERNSTALGCRSTPPLTRARIRKELNCKLYGPLA